MFNKVDFWRINSILLDGISHTDPQNFGLLARISGKTALLAAASGSVTALVAALLVPDDSPDWLRRGFGVLLLTVGVRELITVWKAYHTEKKSGCS